MIDKTLIKKLEKQLLQLRNSTSDYEKFISKFKEMCEGEEKLLNWIDHNFE